MKRRTLLFGMLSPLAGAVSADRLGCQTNAWKIGAASFADLLARVQDLKRLGFAGFECNVRFVEGEFGRAAAARRRIEDTGVRFWGPHTGLKWPIEQLMKYADGAAQLGAQHVAISGISGILDRAGKINRDALTKKIDTLARFGDYCRGAGLRLAYHTHPDDFASGGAEIEELLAQTKPEQMWTLLDVGHAAHEKADVPAWFRRHHQRIDTMHIRDLRDGRQVPMGQGEFDFRGLAQAVRETGWQGWLTLEEESLNSTDPQYVESVVANGRRLIQKFFGV